MAHATLGLLHLPDEILINVFGFLDFGALCNAVLVCKHFDDLAEPFLYHTIHILTGQQAKALVNCIIQNRLRATWIRSLLVSTKFEDDDGLELLPPTIRLMRNLLDLRLETPDCNSKFPDERTSWVSLQDRYERIFEHSSAAVPKGVGKCLPNLRSCKFSASVRYALPLD